MVHGGFFLSSATDLRIKRIDYSLVQRVCK
jgi:hypothetical protein